MKFLLTPKTTASILTLSSLFLASDLMANSCSKADIDYYLQRGFNHDQVIRLCAGSGAPTPVAPRAPAPTQYAPQYPAQYGTNTTYQSNPAPIPQSSGLREDQVYLSAALKAKNVQLTPTSLTYSSEECVEYGHPNIAELSDNACVNSKVTVNFAGLTIIKTSSGLFLIKDAEFIVQGNIKREYLNFDSVRRQEKSAVRELLPNTPNQVDIPVRKDINPKHVAEKLKKYITP